MATSIPATLAEGVITNILAGIIKRPSVDVPAAKAPEVAEQLVNEIKKSETLALTPVKSAWLSKINWTQAAGIAFTVVALFGFDIPPEVRAQIIAGIVAVMGVVTWALKTFFTGSVTPSSAVV